ncbi:uncharacterized protein [Diadema setosum]|uniref:uncharacterized protein n=1 Tax=Diadema setosum TaxID=31175 RepID=UPI003B3B9124
MYMASSREEILELRDEVETYKPGCSVACPDTIEFPDKVFIGLFGRTGCGKTSLINSLKYAVHGKLRRSKWLQVASQENAGGHTMHRKLADLTRSIFVIDNRGLDNPGTVQAKSEITAQLGRYPLAVITHVDVAKRQSVENLAAVLRTSGIRYIYEVANITLDKPRLEEVYQVNLLSLLQRCMKHSDDNMIFRHCQAIEQMKKEEAEREKQKEEKMERSHRETIERIKGQQAEREREREKERVEREKRKEEEREQRYREAIKQIEVEHAERENKKEKEREQRFKETIEQIERAKENEIWRIMESNQQFHDHDTITT